MLAVSRATGALRRPSTHSNRARAFASDDAVRPHAVEEPLARTDVELPVDVANVGPDRLDRDSHKARNLLSVLTVEQFGNNSEFGGRETESHAKIGISRPEVAPAAEEGDAVSAAASPMNALRGEDEVAIAIASGQAPAGAGRAAIENEVLQLALLPAFRGSQFARAGLHIGPTGERGPGCRILPSDFELIVYDQSGDQIVIQPIQRELAWARISDAKVISQCHLKAPRSNMAALSGAPLIT